MAKKGKKKSRESTTPKPEIIEKGIEKKNGNGLKLEAVTKGVESLSSTASGAINTGASRSNNDFAGYIFLCNGRTKPECFSYRVFGLPSPRIDVVTRIKENTKLFLFDTDVKLLYGVYSATSTGTMDLEPRAFGGRFPAQVRFEIFKECMPVPESSFRHVIKDNYQGRSKFRQDLSADQVENLISLFRPLSPLPSATHISSLSNEAQSRRILLEEIEKQSRSPGISSPMSRQAAGSQYIASRLGHSSYQSLPMILPTYESNRPFTLIDRAHERQSVPYQHFPVSGLLPRDNLYHHELLRQSHFPEYSASAPQPHGLYNRYTNERLLSGIEMNPHMGLPNDYNLYKSQDIGQSHGQVQIPQQISAPPQESDKAPSSVLAAAYWVAVASEIPQPGVIQTSDPAHNTTGQNSTSLQYKPPNLNSSSILDAYWEAKALEDSRQHPGPSHMHAATAPNYAESAQGQSQSQSAPYWAAVDQNQLLHSNQQQIPSNLGNVYPISHEVGNQVATYAPELQQQAAYDPTKPQMQYGFPPYEPTYNL